MSLGLSIDQICEVLKTGLGTQGVQANSVELVNNSTLKIAIAAKKTGSVDLKSEVAYAMSFAHGLLRDGDKYELDLEYIGVEATKPTGERLMHAISPIESVANIAAGSPIEWLNKTIFQDHSHEFVQSIAKRRVSELENGMRRLIAQTLADLHGTNWWSTCVGNKVRQSTEKMYVAQEGVTTTDGNTLIYFTFLLDLRKIVVSNWNTFDPIFKNQARFTRLLEDLNLIRRAEAHNRELSLTQINDLELIHNEIMNQIATVMPDAVSSYLVDNWRLQLRNIFETNISNHSEAEVKQGDAQAAFAAVERQIRRYEDLETRVSSVLVPPGKAELNSELIAGLKKVKQTLVEMIAIAKTGDIDKLNKVRAQNELANAELQAFQEKYLMSEL